MSVTFENISGQTRLHLWQWWSKMLQMKMYTTNRQAQGQHCILY